MKAVLRFNLDNEQDSSNFEHASKAEDYHLALCDVAMDIFRPSGKHGYSNPSLDQLRDLPEVQEAISLLEHMFYRILDDKKIEV